MKVLAAGNFELRSRTGFDLGMLIFLPVHEGFGGRIRYLISGGSALPADVMKAFYGMGFNFFEGYGLTETAPVLTVTSPKEKPIAGSVGRPLPGIEVKIAEADGATGVGEVIARGRNVMAGYWENEIATAEAIRDGWFHTGDLGRFDDKGNLYLVGRSKDVIVDANGKNVYPDEIEELYADSPYIKELSVVGVPDGIGEQVACAVVPDLEHDPALSRPEVEAKIEEHFRKVSADLPIWKRVRGVYFWEEDLPKTAKRSVKRRDVAAEIARLRKKSEETKGALAVASGDRGQVGLAARNDRHRLGAQAGRRADRQPLRRAGVRQPDVRGAVERAGERRGGAPRERRRHHARLRRRAAGAPGARPGRGGARAGRQRGRGRQRDPRPLGGLGGRQARPRAGAAAPLRAGAGDEGARGRFTFPSTPASSSPPTTARTSTWGRSRWRWATRGRIWRRWRRPTTSSATATGAPTSSTSPTWCRWSGADSIRKSMDTTLEVLAARAQHGGLPRRDAVGDRRAGRVSPQPRLPRAARRGRHPAGAHRRDASMSLPKGTAIPRARALTVSFGPFLTADWLATLTKNLPQQESWRLVAAFTQRAVENLRDGVATALDADAARDAWDGSKLGPDRRARRDRRAGACSGRCHEEGRAATSRWSPAGPASSGRTSCVSSPARQGREAAKRARAGAQRRARLAARAGGRDRRGIGHLTRRRQARARRRHRGLSPGRPRLAPAGRRAQDVCGARRRDARPLRGGRARGRAPDRDGLDQRDDRRLAPRRRRRRRGGAHADRFWSPAGPTTPASTIRKRRRAAPAATRWSW